jgi:hypothetical protein
VDGTDEVLQLDLNAILFHTLFDVDFDIQIDVISTAERLGDRLDEFWCRRSAQLLVDGVNNAVGLATQRSHFILLTAVDQFNYNNRFIARDVLNNINQQRN